MNKLILVLQRMFSLLVVFLMLGATTITSGRIFGHPWSGTEIAAAEEPETSLQAPDALQKRDLSLLGASFEVRDSLSWFVKTKAGNPAGIVLSSEGVGADIEGFAGRTPVFVHIGLDGKIAKMAVGQNDETPAFLMEAAKGVFPKYYGVEASKALEVEVDAVTGATYSSTSLINNVKKVLSVYNASEVKIQQAPGIGWLKTIAVLLVFAFGLVVSFKFRGKKAVRLAVLALNVGVTGFWCGQFLSLSILRGWMLNGFNLITVLPTFVMLLIALLMPYLGRHNYFCTNVCPYGSLQELVWHIPVKKLKLKPAVIKWMTRVRTIVFICLMALLWLGWGSSILDYEPFGAFLVKAAAPAVMVLAGTFVVLAVFIPRPWCKTFCPVGEMLHLAETPMFKHK